jgi:hypothetical protein
MISDTIIIAIITAVVSIGGSIGATYLQSRKWREGELPAQAAGTADIITGTSLELVSALRAEMKLNKEKQNDEITALRSELETIRADNTRMREKLLELEDVKEWAERLVHQVQSLGGDPVKMRIRNVVPKTP